MLSNLRFLHLLFFEGTLVSHTLADILSNAPGSLVVLRLYISSPGNVADKAVWEGVDSVLTGPKFGNLRYFEVENHEIDPADLESSLSVFLPNSYSRGLLWGSRRFSSSACK